MGEERGGEAASGGSSTASLVTGLGLGLGGGSVNSSDNAYEPSAAGEGGLARGAHSSASSFDIEMDEAVRLLSKDVHTVRVCCTCIDIPSGCHVLGHTLWIRCNTYQFDIL